MRVYRAALLLALATLFATSGCARWTLFPKSAAPIPSPGEKPQRTSLLEAAGIRRGDQSEQKESTGRDQQVVNDLTHLDPALAMARLAERQGDPNEARRQYQRFIDKNPKHPLPHHRLGVMAAREAKYDQAEAHFRMATRLAPPTAELLSDMGYLFYLQDRLDEAENLLRQATQLEPANHNANNNLGLVLAARGNFDNSLKQFRRVNNEAEARANLAYMFSQRGEFQQAREEYLRALTHDKSLSNAAHALLQVEEARKREEAALAKYQEQRGDNLIEPTAPPAQQRPYAAQAQWNGYSAQPAQYDSGVAAQQMPTMQPQATPQMAAHRPVANQPSAAPVNQSQSHLLMPIPAPPADSVTNYPSGNQQYPQTGVQLATHVETASRFSHEAVVVQPNEDQQQITADTTVQPATTSIDAVQEPSRWEDAWHQLAKPGERAAESISDGEQVAPAQEATDEVQAPSSGVRISIGG